MKKSSEKRVTAGVALVVVALSLVDSALAKTCAANTFSPTATAGSGGCEDCPDGTVAAGTPAGNAKTYCEGIKANWYGTKGAVGTKHAVVTACPFSGVSAGHASQDVARSTCNVGTKPTQGDWWTTDSSGGGANSKWFYCPEGTYADPAIPSSAGAVKFCQKIEAGYWGTVGTSTKHAFKTGTSDGSLPTACTTTFSAATATGITSDRGGTSTKTACKTKPGYIITSVEDKPDNEITVAKAAAGTKADGGTALVKSNDANKGTAAQTATNCGAGTTSEEGWKKCGKIAAGFYGTQGNKDSDGVFTTDASSLTACTTTFSDSDSAAGITSDASATTTTKTACKTKPGYIITSEADEADDKITVEKAAKDKYAAGGTALVTADSADKGTATETADACPFAGTTSATGSVIADCTPDCNSAVAGIVAKTGAGTCECKKDFYGTPTDASDSTSTKATKGCTACPNGHTTATAGSGAIQSCSVGSKPSSGSYFIATADSGKWHVCPAGTTAATIPTADTSKTYCEGIAAGYYGKKGGASTKHAFEKAGSTELPTACTTTFSDTTKDTATGITSDAAPDGETVKTACKTKPGYIITSALNAADDKITVEKAAAGTYAAGGTALVTADSANKGTDTETATNCAAGKTSAAGDASCTNCAAGKTSAAGDASCTNCAAGKTSAAGDASCTNCAAGKTSVAGGACTDCPAGKTSVAGAASCTSTTTTTTTSDDHDDHDGHDHASATPSLPIAAAITIVGVPLLIY